MTPVKAIRVGVGLYKKRFIETRNTGDQPYSDTSPYEVSECSLVEPSVERMSAIQTHDEDAATCYGWLCCEKFSQLTTQLLSFCHTVRLVLRTH